MRQKLIQWLVEDILPEVKTNHDGPGTIVKFAREKNLAPALVEALGQLFNTAKTLTFLEKSANRGGTFPILDVPELVQTYTAKEKESVKQASEISLSWEMTADSVHDLPSQFKGLLEPDVLQTKIEEIPVIRVNAKKAAADRSWAKLQLSHAQQDLFNTTEDTRETLDIMAKLARQNSDITFSRFESDARYLYGEDIVPVVDQVAHYFASSNLKVARSNSPGSDRLIRDYPLLTKLATLRECFDKKSIAEQAVKQASGAMSPETTDPDVMGAAFDMGLQGKDNTTSMGRDAVNLANRPNPGESKHKPFKNPSSQSGRSEDGHGSSGEKGKGHAAGSGSYFGSISDGLDKAVAPVASYVGERAKKVLDSKDNTEQKHVDTSMDDVHQIAMLQNLMTTDEVLSEADPQRVIETFNTIRHTMPALASDPNVMRVALRSAIQHDGISPFDIKGFLDTQLSHQKVDWNQRALNAHKYEGQPLSGKPQ